MKTAAVKIEFYITRPGELFADGESMGVFGSRAEALDMACRFAQDLAAPYVVYYQ